MMMAVAKPSADLYLCKYSADPSARLVGGSIDNSGVELLSDAPLGIDPLLSLPSDQVPQLTSETRAYLTIRDGSHHEVLSSEQ